MRTRVLVVATICAVMFSGGCGGADDGASTTTRSEPSITTPITTVPLPVSTPSSVPTATSAVAPTTSTPMSTVTSTTVATTTPSSTSLAPTAPVTLLVVDVDGVRLWSEMGERPVLTGWTVASAMPDRVGGIVFQEFETGAWRPADTAEQSTASWQWIGEGTPQPIRWVRTLDGPDEIVVRPPADGWVQPVDTAIVDGHPTLAFVRTRYFQTTATEPDVNPWWDSAEAELVVRDLATGNERVVRTQNVGWEFDYRTPSLGEAARRRLRARLRRGLLPRVVERRRHTRRGRSPAAERLRGRPTSGRPTTRLRSTPARRRRSTDRGHRRGGRRSTLGQRDDAHGVHRSTTTPCPRRSTPSTGEASSWLSGRCPPRRLQRCAGAIRGSGSV